MYKRPTNVNVMVWCHVDNNQTWLGNSGQNFFNGTDVQGNICNTVFLLNMAISNLHQICTVMIHI